VGFFQFSPIRDAEGSEANRIASVREYQESDLVIRTEHVVQGAQGDVAVGLIELQWNLYVSPIKHYVEVIVPPLGGQRRQLQTLGAATDDVGIVFTTIDREKMRALVVVIGALQPDLVAVDHH